MASIDKTWKVAPPAPKRFRSAHPEYVPLVANVLWNRGLRTRRDIDAFLNPDYEKHTHAPLLMKGMRKALRVLEEALDAQSHILIYGDYDADGVCASVLLRETLEALGASRVSVYIPHREEEGYGLNRDAITNARAQEVDLIVTVDCGSTNVEEVALAKELGMRVIVTDHHAVPEKVPAADAFLNPHQKGERYPFPDLAGSAVAFKLAAGLIEARRRKGKKAPRPGWEKWLLDLVALATVTDVMPLVGENRTLVRYGLFVLAQTKREGFRALMRAARVEPTIDRPRMRTNLNSFTLGFVLGPRINAAGRMRHAQLAFDLLRATTREEADALARELEQANRMRQSVVRAVLEGIDTETIDEQAALVVGDASWPIGVLGIVAGRLADRYGKPAFIYQKQEGRLVGSVRTPAHVHTVQVLESCSDILLKFGGHAQAGGFTAELTYEEQLRERLVSGTTKYVEQHGGARAPVLSVDASIASADISWELYEALGKLEPYGEQNPRPLFAMRNVTVEDVRVVGSQEAHLRCRIVGEDGRAHKAMGFGLAAKAAGLRNGDEVDVAFHLTLDEYNGRRDLMVELVDMKKA